MYTSSSIKNNPVKRMRFLMNTFCSIQAEGEDGLSAAEAIEEAFGELKRLEVKFSRYLADSEISRVNQAARNSAVKVDSEVFELISRAWEISRLTAGAFDISLGAAIDFWRAQREAGTFPSQDVLDELKQRTGFENILLDQQQQSVYFTKPGIQLDLGALAKGYALDKAVQLLKARGISCGQLDLGGNIYVLDSQPQSIAIRNPLAPEKIAATVELTGQAISTSANYERSFKIKGKCFGHLLDPLTGSPVESDILSVSVISEDAALADALSTAIFVSGMQKGMGLLGGMDGVEAVIISKGLWPEGIKVHQLKGGE